MQLDIQALKSLPDADLERFAAGGDRAAFAELYERYAGRVHDFLMRLVRNEDDAADLMQETFVRAMKALSAERAGKAQFSTYIFTIARNLALTRIERGKRTVSLTPDDADSDGDGAATPPPHLRIDDARAESPADAFEARELADFVWRAAEALDAKQYSLLDLHVRQGLESAEIAAVLGVSKGNAYTMLSRLRDQFESAVASFVMFYRGRRKCADLDRLLHENAVTAISVAARKLIERHTARCETCQDQRRRLVNANAILRALAIVPLPVVLKQQVSDAAWQSLVSSTAAGAGAAGAGAGAGGAGGAGGGAATVAGTTGIVPFIGGGILQLAIAAVALVGVSVPAAVFVVPRTGDIVGAIEDAFTSAPPPVAGDCVPQARLAIGPSSPDAAYAAGILESSNAFRAARGLPPLRPDPRLDAAAAEYASFVAETQWWTVAVGTDIHRGADCRDMLDRAVAHGYPQALVAENVMWASVGVPPPELFDALLAGPHEDPADARFVETGVACAARAAPPPAELACVQVYAQPP